MSKESYARGFCKVAEEHGIDPVQLAKFAAPATNAPPAPESTNTIRKADLIKNAPLIGKNIRKRPMPMATSGAISALGTPGAFAANRARALLESVRRPSASDLTEKMIQDYFPSKKTIFRDKMPLPRR